MGSHEIMDDTARFEPGSNVAADIVEGEAILIRLEDGVYFSMNAVGSHIWQLIEAGLGVDAMVEWLSTSAAAAADVVAGDLRVFLDRLLELRLIQPCASSAAGAPPKPEAMSYSTPVVEVYEDMAELLALDPPAPGRT